MSMRLRREVREWPAEAISIGKGLAQIARGAAWVAAVSFPLWFAPVPGLAEGPALTGIVPVTLVNPGFEAPYTPVPPIDPSQKAKITGKIANGWEDNSNWGDVDIDYAADPVNPHSGQTSQRMTVSRVGNGYAQLIQSLTLEKGVYSAHVWLRGTAESVVRFQLRLVPAPYTKYAFKEVILTDNWQEVTITGTVPEKKPIILMILAEHPVTCWVADASIENVTNVASTAPPHAGNLLAGGSFEAGVSFGWSIRLGGPPTHAFADPRPSIDATTATDGKRSLSVGIPDGDTAYIFSPLIHYNINRPHTLSLDLKASQPTTVRAEFCDGLFGKNFDVGTEWQRYTWTLTLPYLPYARLRLTCKAAAGGPEQKLWMDAVQLEEADHSTPYAAPFPCEMTLRLAKPGGVVFDGEGAQVSVRVMPAPPSGAALRLSAVDLYGRQRQIDAVPLPSNSFSLPDFPQNPRGLFKLRGEVVDSSGGPLSAPVEMIFARLPKPRELDPKASYFGIHIPLNPDFIAIAHATGQRWIRLHDTSVIGKWAIAEPSPGNFEFYDNGITAAHDAGLAILGMFDGAPAWATKTPRTDESYFSIWNIPDSLEPWKNYVRTVTSHYRGRIDDWEVWNEPWGKWWFTSKVKGATPEYYAELLKAAYQTAKEANPQARIIGIDTVNNDAWTAKTLAASGTDCFDVFSFHDYTAAFFGGPNNKAMSDALFYSTAQAKVGQAKPLWDTEDGPSVMTSFYAPETGGPSFRDQMAQSVRFDVSQIAAGVHPFFLYALPLDPAMGATDFCADEFDRSIKPILAARAVLASLIDGAPCSQRREPLPGVDAYDFRQDSHTITVLWSYDSAAHELPVPPDSSALDVLGNPITGPSVHLDSLPVYFIH